jgi:Holliday junction resolvasome RuvABC endonuclease subunit
MVRKALRDAGHPGDDDQVAMVRAALRETEEAATADDDDAMAWAMRVHIE